MDSSGGTLLPLKLAWSIGLGATLGDGSQRMPMISLRDYLDVVHWASITQHASGPYNLTLPQPTSNAEFSDALAIALRGRDSSACRRRSSALRSANWRVSWSAICMWSLSV